MKTARGGRHAWVAVALVLGLSVAPTGRVAAQAPPPQAPTGAPAEAPPAPQTTAKTKKKPDKPAPKALTGATRSLFMAVEVNDMKGVQAALDAGAAIDAQNADGLTAADVAVDKGHFIIAHYLLSRRLLERTAPVALTPKPEPGAGPETRTAETPSAAKTPAAKPPATFATPRAKPQPPREPPKAPDKPADEIAAAPAEPEPSIPADKIEPEPDEDAAGKRDPAADAPKEDTTAEAPRDTMTEPAAKPDTDTTVEVTVEPPPGAGKAPMAEAPPAVPGAVGEVAPDPAVPEKPLADEGVVEFFKRLVDAILPGGEPPPAPPEPEPPAIVEETSPAEPDEVVVEITGDEPRPSADGLEPPAKLEEGAVETVTAEPDAALEPDADRELETVTVEDQAKPPEPSLIDRLAGLFTSDQNKPDPKTADKPGAVKDEITTAELPLPPPRPTVPRKFSPKFLDKLADFLESGDEAAFKQWMPEMQVMNVESPYGRRGLVTPTPDELARAQRMAEKKAGAGAGAGSLSDEPAPPPPVPTTPVETVDLGKGAAKGTAAKTAAAPTGTPTGTPKGQAEAAKEAGAETDVPGALKDVFGKLVDAMTPEFGDKDRAKRVVLAPDEKLARLRVGEKATAEDEKAGEKVTQGAARDTARDGDAEAAAKKPERPTKGSPQGPPRYWPVTDLETAQAPAVAVGPRGRIALKTSLTGVTLALGQSVTLENSFPPLGDGIDPFNDCVKKNRGTTLFCLEPVDWPETLQADFLVPTILYTGQKAIARYDQGIASRFHALYPSDSFEKVVRYFYDRFGEPTEAWNRSIAPFAQPRQDNPTMAWRSVDPATGAVTVLEIRKYDDSRGGFPDTSRGAVMLYLANSPPIFPQVSSHELMRLSRSRMAPPGQQPAAAAPAETPDNADEPGAPDSEKPVAAKDPRAMTAEEMQAERRRRKALESGGELPASAPEGAIEGVKEDSFELPPDPQGR